MKDTERMNEEEKRRYIFAPNPTFKEGRFNWLTNNLLGDIRTFLDGIEYFRIQGKVKPAGKSPRGGGNLSAPILINTALEFVAELYAGKTEAMEKDKPVFSIDKDLERKFENEKPVSENLKGIFEEKGYQLSTHAYFKKKNNVWKIVDNGDIDNSDIYYFKEGGISNTLDVLFHKYNATENTKKFIRRYFPEKYKEIPLLLWDGIRNGLIHTFSPKPFEYNGSYIRFQFYVENQNFPSHIEKVNSTILIKINIFELYRVLEKAVEAYLAELENSTVLQEKFFRAWSSIEGYKRVITSGQKEKSEEAGVLFDYLDSKSSAFLLKDLNDRLSVDVLKIYSLNSLKIRRS